MSMWFEADLPEVPELWEHEHDGPEDEPEEFEPREDQFMSDAEADADVLASAGMGTDEDYGCFNDPDDTWETEPVERDDY